MSLGIARFAGTPPTECTVPQCGRRVRVGLRSGKELPLGDVNNSRPLGSATLETCPICWDYFFGSSLVASSCRRIRLQRTLTNPPTNK